MTEQEYLEFVEVFNKWYKQNKKDIPKRVVDDSTEKILKAYAREYRLLHDFLVENLATLLSQDTVLAVDMLTLLNQFDTKMTELSASISKEVSGAILEAHLTGMLYNQAIAEAVDTVGAELVGFGNINTYKAEQLVADTMDDLLYSTENTKRHIKKIVRESVAKHMQLNALSGENHSEIAKAIREQLKKSGLSEKIKKEGFVGIIDKIGRKWNLKTYVEMVVSTKMSQAYHEGLKDSMEIRDTDLARISTHKAEDHCINFEGLIISMKGQTRGYPSYDQLKATGLIFHPNCRHICYPVHRIELLHDDYIRDHEKKLIKLKEKLKKQL